MLATKNIYIIIPCYNEEENITDLVDEIENACKESKDKWNIIVVNDASIDSTYELVKAKKSVTVLNQPINLGVGGTVQTGLIYAKSKEADIAIKLDGDCQHNPIDIPNLIRPIIEEKADIVIGSRFLQKDDGFKSTLFRRFGIKILQKVCKLLVNKNITDPTSGFRAYNKKAINYFADNYPSFDYPEPEEVVLAAKSNLLLYEVPVKMRERKKGKSSISFYGSIYYMVKVILAMVFIEMRDRE